MAWMASTETARWRLAGASLALVGACTLSNGTPSSDDGGDSAVDDSAPCSPRGWYADGDGDGYGDEAAVTTACDQPSGAVSQAGDCDDFDPETYPGADELCDGIDNDCDGQLREDGSVTWFGDDGDRNELGDRLSGDDIPALDFSSAGTLRMCAGSYRGAPDQAGEQWEYHVQGPPPRRRMMKGACTWSSL